ncbi:MAG: aldo/keto reductase [candidate division KSB1 bacterium]|nr:aldo/keto reductase [candidate division KSB1 bacterium]
MRTRKLGWTGEELTVIGLGAWAMGGGGWAYAWGPQDDRDSIATIQRALDLGINWIDTAAVYGLGHSEEIVGQAIQGRRDQVFLATKCSRVWDAQGHIYGRLKAWSVRQELEASLRRLRVDTIDLYQIHWPDPDQDLEEAWTEMAKAVEEGKVRYLGVSNFSVAQMERLRAIHPIASLQPPYSLLRRGVENEILPYCARHNIGVIAYSPLGSGLLTGKFDRQKLQSLPPDDWRRRGQLFQEPEFSVNLAFVDELQKLAARYTRPVSHLAIAWVLRRPEITAAIVGARRPSQIEETAPAADWELPSELEAEIDRLLQQRERQLASASI